MKKRGSLVGLNHITFVYRTGVGLSCHHIGCVERWLIKGLAPQDQDLLR